MARDQVTEAGAEMLAELRATLRQELVERAGWEDSPDDQVMIDEDLDDVIMPAIRTWAARFSAVIAAAAHRGS